MLIEQLAKYKDEYAMRLAQGRTLSHNVRDTWFTNFKEDPMSTLAEKAAKKAAALRAAKSTKQTKTAKPTAKSTKKGEKKERASSRVQIKDKKGKVVTGRDNTFVCVECGHEITGPWSYKTHLVKVHDYSRKKAGLREE